MTAQSLHSLLRQQFPNAGFLDSDETLTVGSFPEWDSLAHFNFMMLVEETYGVRFSIEDMAELKSLSEIRATLLAKGLDI